jgi:uncharacterized membrane protein YgcG
MDADSIQREARASMSLSQSEIDSINARLLQHMQKESFNVPMLRLVSRPKTGEWVAVPNIHIFYSEFRHVTCFREKKISDATLSLAVNLARMWYMYVMGMLSYFKQRGLTWIITRARLILTPYMRGETVKSVSEQSSLMRFMDPAAKPPTISSEGKVQVRKCDVEAIEFIIRVDLGLSHLASLTVALSPPPSVVPPIPSVASSSKSSSRNKKPVLNSRDNSKSNSSKNSSSSSSSSSSSGRSSSSSSSNGSDDSDSDDLPYALKSEQDSNYASNTSPLARIRGKSLPLLPVLSSHMVRIDEESEPALLSVDTNVYKRVASLSMPTPISPRHPCETATTTVSKTSSGVTIVRRRSCNSINMPISIGAGISPFVQVLHTGGAASEPSTKKGRVAVPVPKMSKNLERMAIVNTLLNNRAEKK